MKHIILAIFLLSSVCFGQVRNVSVAPSQIALHDSGTPGQNMTTTDTDISGASITISSAGDYVCWFSVLFRNGQSEASNLDYCVAKATDSSNVNHMDGDWRCQITGVSNASDEFCIVSTHFKKTFSASDVVKLRGRCRVNSVGQVERFRMTCMEVLQ